MSMEAKVISRIRMIIWVILFIMIAVIIIHHEAIGSWITDMLTSGTDSQLQQLLR